MALVSGLCHWAERPGVSPSSSRTDAPFLQPFPRWRTRVDSWLGAEPWHSGVWQRCPDSAPQQAAEVQLPESWPPCRSALSSGRSTAGSAASLWRPCAFSRRPVMLNISHMLSCNPYAVFGRVCSIFFLPTFWVVLACYGVLRDQVCHQKVTRFHSAVDYLFKAVT